MDADNPGFGVWLYPSGKRAFIYAYRLHGKKGRITLHASGLSEARDEYRELRKLVRQGIDPQQQKAEERRKREQDLTFGQLADKFIDDELSRKSEKYARNAASALNNDPIKHWKTGYSARALAYCWGIAEGFPSEVSKLFQGSPLKTLEFL